MWTGPWLGFVLDCIEKAIHDAIPVKVLVRVPHCADISKKLFVDNSADLNTACSHSSARARRAQCCCRCDLVMLGRQLISRS